MKSKNEKSNKPSETNKGSANKSRSKTKVFQIKINLFYCELTTQTRLSLQWLTLIILQLIDPILSRIDVKMFHESKASSTDSD